MGKLTLTNKQLKQDIEIDELYKLHQQYVQLAAQTLGTAKYYFQDCAAEYQAQINLLNNHLLNPHLS